MRTNLQLTRKENVLLQLFSSIAKENGIVNLVENGEKLHYLLFLVTYCKFDNDGNVIGLIFPPRYDYDFIIDMNIVTCSNLFNILRSLDEKNIIKCLDKNCTKVKIINKPNTDNINNILRIVLEKYVNKNTEEMQNIIAQLLGIDNEETFAILYGANIRDLLEFVREMSKKLESEEIVDE